MKRPKGWIIHRVNKLDKLSTTAKVATTLKLHEVTLRRWTTDYYFQRARVAFKNDGRWNWNRDLLRVWLIAIGTAKENELAALRRECKEKRNPPDDYPVLNKAAARAMLGIPADHIVNEAPPVEVEEEL